MKDELKVAAKECIPTTAVVEIRPDMNPAVIKLKNEITSLLNYAETFEIKEDKDLKTATNDLATMSRLKKVLEEERKGYLAPLRQHTNQINDMFKDISGPLFQADKITRDKVLDYRKEQERKAREAEEINRMRREAAEREMRLKGELTESVKEMEPVEPPGKTYADLGSSSTAKQWKWEVTDFSALPDEYKLPDAVRIRKVISAGGNIPGVRSWQEETLRVNAPFYKGGEVDAKEG